ncbi:dTDP-4-dehydrorhamnose 3,5-epimerase family protein [Cellulomonas marina]|uniref:dTDP-4-dehydrorhamnose 3,5-epimerase n=1 Tax=Cellulomonas marina TaxID=988821 RepID=A0A1I1AI04_9CELL|nr:dTDP-4-dehydrorhamnose 3,5-epimerase family protein [Cellulomonas marina]GIG29718.1 dTDP-4-dehydrorhamnose 3,5-epimerase [Cellulomonas marina]SFB35973.1 dTDP-4-dehydrorhamnose 3,5-epimerase [Cellulomonas marina]
MRLEPTAIAGVYVVELELRQDERGFFARSFDQAVFAAHGLENVVEQANVSFNVAAGTLRGMHLQVAPAPEAKLVRCTRGAIVDKIVDVRDGSPTYLQHVSVELTAENHRALYVPPFFAHGYQTLVPDTEVIYQVSGRYTPEAERGLRFDDPVLGLEWPLPVDATSPKDASWSLVDPATRRPHFAGEAA